MNNLTDKEIELLSDLVNMGIDQLRNDILLRSRGNDHNDEMVNAIISLRCIGNKLNLKNIRKKLNE